MSPKPTLVLLPGLLCDQSVWRHQQQHLADRVDIYIASFRGMSSFANMVDTVLQQAPDRFYLAGHSMGGRVAMQLLDAAPERIVKLALLDTAVHPPSPGEADKRQVLLDLAREQGMAALARAWAAPMVHPERQNDRALMDSIFQMVERYSFEDFNGQVQALLTRADAAPFLKKAPRDTLVLCGREDSWSPPQQHREIASLLPDKPQVKIIEECGHMATMERPEEVTQLLAEWLS